MTTDRTQAAKWRIKCEMLEAEYKALARLAGLDPDGRRALQIKDTRIAELEAENQDLKDAFSKDQDRIVRLEAQLVGARTSRDFYLRRCDLLQANQSTMRDPERMLVCDILANGALLPDPDGKRYGNAAREEE